MRRPLKIIEVSTGMTSTLFKLYNFVAFSFPLVQGSCLSVTSESCIFPFLSNDGKNLFYECDQERKCATEVEADSHKAIKYSFCSDGCFDNSTVSYCRSTHPDGQSCKFPFKYGGLIHHGCTTMGRSESWCMLNDGITYAYCDRDCPGYEPAEDLMDTCKTTEGQICQFPFLYGSKIYYGCTLDGHDYPWCPTVVNGQGEPEFFGNCTYHCEGFADEVGRCRSVYGTACIFPFEYKGIVYKECTEVDHVWKWCSVFNFPNGTMRNWGECLSKTCEPMGEDETSPSTILLVFFILSLIFNVSLVSFVIYKCWMDRRTRRKVRFVVKSHFNEAQNSFIINEEIDE